MRACSNYGMRTTQPTYLRHAGESGSQRIPWIRSVAPSPIAAKKHLVGLSREEIGGKRASRAANA